MGEFEVQPTKVPASEWVFRLGVIGGVLVVLAAIFLMMALAFNGELVWQRSEITGERVFLVLEVRERGIGWAQTTLLNPAPEAGQVCTQTNLRYWFWEGTAANEQTRYCECYIQAEAQFSYMGSITCP